MSCYHPLKAFKVGVHVSGKDKYKICSYDTHHVTSYNGETWEPCIEPFYTRNGIHRSEFIEIPCGKCLGCRLDYSRDWATRCMLELQYHDSSYFVTLTYDDDHIEKNRIYYPDLETGEAFEHFTLSKRDFQLFMKKLRKYTGQKLRYYACGEYGSKTFRPHYHAIIFGLELDDLVPYKRNGKYWYYISKRLSEIWDNGFVVVGEVTWETCAYTARYIMKKLDGIDKMLFDDFGVEPEFTLMSRKPGIARQYFDEHPDLYRFDEIILKTEKGGLTAKPPRYYDKLFDIENPEEMKAIKQSRKAAAAAAEKLKLSQTSLSKTEYLEVQEFNKKAAIKSLRRDMI